MEVISEHPLFIQHIEDAHSALRCSPLLKLSIRDGDNGNFKKVIDAIRRSGSQETTDGNGFANAVGWAVANTGQPFELLNGIRVASRWNMQTHVGEENLHNSHPAEQRFIDPNDVEEGDDYINNYAFMIWPGIEQHIRKQWTMFGFHMKIEKITTGIISFTGYDFYIRDGCSTGYYCPSIRTNIVSSCYSVSTTARVGWRDGYLTAVHEVGANAYMARAVSYRDTCAPLANAFLLLSESHQEHYRIITGEEVKVGDVEMQRKGLLATMGDTANYIRAALGPPESENQRNLWMLSAGATWGSRIENNTITMLV